MAWHDSVSVGSAARMPTVTHDAGHAATYLLCAVFALHLPDEAADADQNGIGGSVVDGINLDPEERQPLMNARQILHVARQTIERFNHDDIEGSCRSRIHEARQPIATKDRTARACLVFESLNDLQAPACGMRPTQSDLIFRRFFVLQVSRESGVDDCAGHLSKPLSAS